MLKAVLLDDERLAMEMLDLTLQEIGGIQVVEKHTDPLLFIEKFKELHNYQIDVAFIDIAMPSISGIEVAELVNYIDPSVSIVFVTAFSEYAVTAFDLNSIDYILKPIIKKRLEKTIKRLQYNITDEKNLLINSSGLSIQCFGEFTIYSDGVPLKWRTKKVKALCAYLIHHQNQFTDIDILIEKLFGELEYDKAKINFHTTMSSLRRMFKQNGYTDVIQKVGKGYCLSTKKIKSDIGRFELFVSKNTEVTSMNIESFLNLFNLYKGEYLQTMDEIDFIGKREELNQKTLDSFRKIVDFYLTEKNRLQAIIILTKIVDLFPYVEGDALRLMKLYEAEGNRAEAIKVYYNLKKHIETEYNLEPSIDVSKFINRLL